MIRRSLPIIFILVAIGLFYTFIDPIYKETQVLKEEEAKFDEALSRSREFLALRDTLRERYNTLPSDDLNRLEKLLPNHVDNVRLILDLDGIASAYGLRLQNFAVSGGGKSSANVGTVGPSEIGYNSMLLSFTVATEYKTLLTFLSDLERSLRIVDVVKLSFGEGQGDINLTTYTITLETYWLE